MFTHSLITAVACLAALTRAAPQSGQRFNSPNWPGSPNSPDQNPSPSCSTEYGWTLPRGKPRTAWVTSCQACTKTSYTTITSTTRRSPVTSVITVTETSTSTAPTSFITGSTTQTVTTTFNSTSTTVTTLSYTASTNSTATTTVPTPAGFTPIQLSLPGAGYNGAAGGSPVQKRQGVNGIVGDEDAIPAAYGPITHGISKRKGPQFPQRVSCTSYTWEKCSTSVKTITKTKTAPVSTAFSTSTTTSITTSVPVGSTTVTLTATSTSVNTIIATSTASTTTTTTIVSTTTLYAACATVNFANTYTAGDTTSGLSNADMANPYNVNLPPGITNAYDCCVAAILNPNSNNFVFFPAVGATPASCGFATTTTCPNPKFNWSILRATNIYYLYGNSNCGSINSIRGT